MCRYEYILYIYTYVTPNTNDVIAWTKYITKCLSGQKAIVSSEGIKSSVDEKSPTSEGKTDDAAGNKMTDNKYASFRRRVEKRSESKVEYMDCIVRHPLLQELLKRYLMDEKDDLAANCLDFFTDNSAFMCVEDRKLEKYANEIFKKYFALDASKSLWIGEVLFTKAEVHKLASQFEPPAFYTKAMFESVAAKVEGYLYTSSYRGFLTSQCKFCYVL